MAVYFLALTHKALQGYFSTDDSMNLYVSWYPSLFSLIKANFLFFLNSPFYRPMGSAWYRIMFFVAGYHPEAFHAVNLVILMINIWLTYELASRLSDSRETGALAALLIAYQPAFAGLYFDTAYIYDVLCFGFFLAALLVYGGAGGFAGALTVKLKRGVQASAETSRQGLFLHRQAKPPASPFHSIQVTGQARFLLCVLCVCGLNSKEMALTLPICLALYELLYRPAPRNWRIPLITGGLTILLVAGRALDRHSLLALEGYQPVLTWNRFMETSAGFLTNLFDEKLHFSTIAVLLFWVATLLLAWVTRSRALRFAWLFAIVTPLPVAFLTPRGGPQYYIPLFGWVLYFATLLVDGTRSLFGERLFYARAISLFSVVMLLSVIAFRGTGWKDVTTVSEEGEALRSSVDQFHALHPALRPGARILFIDDPLPKHRDDLPFLLRLRYRDPSLIADSVKRMSVKPTAQEFASYDYVLDCDAGHLFDRHPNGTRPGPTIALEWGHPAVFHADWTPVTSDRPAKPGEDLIGKASDLGATEPLVAAATPFPKDPLLNVVAPVEVRVGGSIAAVNLKVGWPEAVNLYRLDFRVPFSAPRGNQPVQLTVNSQTGPAVPIAVK